MLPGRAPRHLVAALRRARAPLLAPAPSTLLAQQPHLPSRRHSSTYNSVDPTEVTHFNALASTWWDAHGSSRLLHLMNPVRLDFIRDCHASQPTPPPSTLRYLDVGCGGGIFAESAARLPNTSHVTALDPSPEVLSIARAHAKRDPALAGKLTYNQGSIEGLEVPTGEEGQFDVVSVFEVVEHVDNPAEFLERCRPFVKPGGWLVMSTIARTWMSWFTTNLVAEDILGIVPKGTHSWEKYINEDELRACLERMGGWSSARCMGVVYVPGLGWKSVPGSEKVGNYFFAVRRDDA
ncbi:probable COQ3 - enzyme of ubiquinone (coenzyme Q) biosynthesis [Cephalotrichum gorgonifer]|uniref:Ubiquinone biosynthesis O-methyltransferase, mitochondrial n=1 Tax=Cephalotrichum gorgonifer TaxID=2041049 RepID=A0AAE8SXH9_9PEZI|nr:probable COQ3 - enzyme of ubiquinone (coenzyme Q) biosynthesis [Cephalotrichum gorgonifer]